jgi:glycosyltransferase involved in cell wall biosynthesis
MNDKVKVSVCMITYGHEKFIEQAINSVLMQECDFEVGLIIANDCSPDQTDEVIQNILENHAKASLIKYIKHDKNLGMMPNFIFALEQCKGDFIALCEGDDYWTDPLKLQKQVDFLEKNLDYVIHSGCATILSDDKNNNTVFGNFTGSNFFTLKDFYTQNNLITGSVIFKNIELDWPVFSKDLVFGDWFLYVMLLSNTKLKGHVSKDIFSVYRVHDGGVMKPLTTLRKIDLYLEQIYYVKKNIGYKHFFPKDISNINNYSIAKFRILMKEKSFSIALISFFVNFKYCGFNMHFKKYLSAIKQHILRN